MASVVKSSYTLKVVPGDVYEYEVEVFFYNFKTKTVEPISSSPQTTPKHLKVPFGFVETVEEVDRKIIKIVNKAGNSVLLAFDKLSPLLDDQDSQMKKNLINLKSSGCSSLVVTLNKLIRAFHESENLVIIESSEKTGGSSKCQDKLKRASTVKKVNDTNNSVQSLSISIDKRKDSYCERVSVSLLKSQSEKYQDSFCSFIATNEHKRCSSDHTSENVSKKNKGGKDTEELEDNELYRGGEKDNVETDKEADEVNEKLAEDNIEEDCDILGHIQRIIKNVEYFSIKFQSIEIPKMVKIDSIRVNQLKESILRAPDKTQCIVGLIKTVDDDGEQVGPYQCWVNAELYVALMEIEMESDDHEHGFVLAVIHTVKEGDGIDNDVIGNFLLNNSKEFASKLHHKLMYQDLLRFACATLSSENSDRTKTFLKTNLRGFAKGNKNVPFFIKFASLPIEYLNKFDRFCHLYEEGSLNGMKMSFRKRMGVNKDLKSKEIIKLELPLKFLKAHLNVSQATREELINKILEKKITFPQYESELKRIAEIQDVKCMVEKISGQNFEESKLDHVELLSDDVLEEFAGAKSLPSGPNLRYLKLVNHINGLKPHFPVDEATEVVAKVSFQPSEKMHLSSVNKLVKEHDIVVFVKGSDKSLNDKFEFSMKQHVLENSAIGVYIDPNNDSVQLGLEHLEEGKPDVKIEPVFVKKAKAVVKEGFRKEFFPIFVMGNTVLFKNKEISSIFAHQLKDAISLLLQQLVGPNSRVLFAFSDGHHGQDLDPSNVLARKEVSVCYLSSKENLAMIESKLEMKVMT